MTAPSASPIEIVFGAAAAPSTSPVEISFDAPSAAAFVARRDIVACRVTRSDSATLYLSDSRYVSPSTDTPGRLSYQPRLVGDIEATRRVSIQPWGDAEPISTIGSISVIAIDGGVDTLLDPAWIGADLQVRLGQDTQAWTDLTPALTGQIDQVVADGERAIKITLVDRLAALAEPIQTLRYSDAEPLEEVQGQRRPFALGDCFSCPIVRRTVDEEHDVHEGPAYREVVRVREGGIVLTPTTDYIPAMAADIHGVELLTPPTRAVVADLRGALRLQARLVGSGGTLDPGTFASSLGAWSAATTGDGEVSAIGGEVNVVRETGTASLSLASALTVGQLYRWRLRIGAYAGGAIEVDHGTVAATVSAVGWHGGVFTAAGTTFTLRGIDVGSVAGTDLTIDDVELDRVTYPATVPALIEYLLWRRYGTAVGSLISLADLTALESSWPHAAGRWCSGSETYAELIRELLRSSLIGVYQDRLGLLRALRWTTIGPSEPVVLEVNAANLASELSWEEDTAPGLAAEVLGKRNWFVHSSGDLLDAIAGTPEASNLQREYRHRRSSTASVSVGADASTARKTPRAVQGLGTLLTTTTGAQALADDSAALYATQQRIFRCDVLIDRRTAVLLEPGQVIRLTHSRIDAGAPRKLRLSSVRARVGRSLLSIEALG